MNLRKGISSFLLLFVFYVSFGQQTAIFTEANLAYKRGIEFFGQGVYGLAQKDFKTTVNLLRPVNEPEWRNLKTDAELHYAKCAVRLNQPEAEKLVLDFLRENSPSPVASQAALEIGDYYFNSKEYDKALTYYEMAPTGTMQGPLKQEIRFKQGYCYFVSKKFSQAKPIFASIKESQKSEWYIPSNYYYACCMFFENRYDDAAKSFQRCEASPKYKDIVPYYLCQIYAAQKKYDQVISYGAPKAAGNIKYKAEFNQLVGQAYFEKGDFKSALPYLEYAGTNMSNLRPADYYQIGYTQYQTKNYKQAIENFEQLTKQDSLLGQNGLYHLGDCYIKTGNKFNARNAFGQAAQMNFDKSVKEEALFNYAKLSYELKFDRDAIETLQKFDSDSKYYSDAQALMSELFLNTRDYDRAISSLEGLKSRNQRLNEAYQKVTFLRGIQLYQSKQGNEARKYFNKSLEYPIDKETAAKSTFWMGTITHEAGEYDNSKQYMASFLSQAKSYPNLPDESSIMMGSYIQGYNYLKAKDYTSAQSYFNNAVDGIKKNMNNLYLNELKTDVLGDATLRAGDCYFKRNKYGEALKNYDEAVNKKYDGFEYALYQKAIIKGIQKNPIDKINALEDLIEKYPNSRYTDEALFQLGATYQDIDKFDQAIPPLRRLVQDFRGKSGLVNQALLKLGLITYNQGNTQSAINYYKQVFANNPENTEAKDALAALEEIYVKDLGKPDEYFAFLETVPGYKVDNVAKENVTFSAAESQFEAGKYAQAIDSYTSYLAKYPNGSNSLTAIYHRAECYAHANVKQYPKALKDYATVVGRGQSKYYIKATEKATLLAFDQEKDYAQAYEFAKKWDESAATDISRLDAQIMALRSAYKLNNSVAVYDYANKVASNPKATNEQIGGANYYLGKIAYDKADFAKAYPALKKATEMSTGEPIAESYHLMAQILFKQKKYTEADNLITDGNQASAGYDDWIARNLILASDVYSAQGDKNGAKAALEAVMENYTGKDKTIIETAKQKYNALGGNVNTIKRTDGNAKFLEMEDGN
jgi:tetratricopeptide (TPR) repeat protein